MKRSSITTELSERGNPFLSSVDFHPNLDDIIDMNETLADGWYWARKDAQDNDPRMIYVYNGYITEWTDFGPIVHMDHSGEFYGPVEIPKEGWKRI